MTELNNKMKNRHRKHKIIALRVDDKHIRKLDQLLIKWDLPDYSKVIRELIKRAVE